MDDFSDIDKLAVKPDADAILVSEVRLNFGRTFDDESDDLFGAITIARGMSISGKKIWAMSSKKDKSYIEILVEGDVTYVLALNTNPMSNPDTYNFLSDHLWNNTGVIKTRATKDDVQKNRFFSLKNLGATSESDVQSFYKDADVKLREWIMNKVGDLEKSKASSFGLRSFPEFISDTWLRNRFLQTASFLTEVFSFPDEITREIFLSAWLTEGGSCLLSGVPGTGKSIVGSEPVLIKKEGVIKEVPIGEFIDSILGKPSNKTDIGLLTDGTQVQTLDKDNKIVWKSLSGVSRHRFTGELICVTTKSGRRITATPDHSFVVQKNGSIQVVEGSKVKLGDIVPSVSKWSSDCVPSIQTDSILPRSEFIYGSEVIDAMDNELRIGEFASPLTQGGFNQYKNGRNSPPQWGMVYSHNHKGMCVPDILSLSEDLGYLIGSFLSEGNILSSKGKNKHICICNGDDDFNDRLERSSRNLLCTFHKYKLRKGNYPMNIYNDSISEIIHRTCGEKAVNKRIPNFAFSAPTEFVRALLRSYFDGDGWVDKSSKSGQPQSIGAITKSEKLAHGISCLLSRFGIFSTIYKKTITKGKYGGNVYYGLTIPSKYCGIFNDKIGFGIKVKKDLSRKIRCRYNSTDMIVGFGGLLEGCARDCGKGIIAPTINGIRIMIERSTRRQRLGRSLAEKYLQAFESVNPKSENVRKLRNLIHSDVVWDEIASVKKIPFDGFVYDFDVGSSPTNTFVAGMGMMVVHNTQLTNLATLLFMNSYGYSDFTYRSPVMIPRQRERPEFIFKDLTNKGERNILTTIPTEDDRKGDRLWVIVPNRPNTNEASIVLDTREDAIKRFRNEHRHKLNSDILDAIESGAVRIGRWSGFIVSQKFSRNRTGDIKTTWDTQRFDGHLLRDPYGIMKGEYYTKSLLKRGLVHSGGKDVIQYVSDVSYDLARYPGDADRFVQWKDEVLQEKRYIHLLSDTGWDKSRPVTLDELKSMLDNNILTDPSERERAKTKIDYIRNSKSYIHRMAEAPESEWKENYKGGKEDRTDVELKNINNEYRNLYGLLMYIINKKDDSEIFNARSNDDILDEMMMDMGITTCSENKTPEDILYTTEISLVEDLDSMGRRVSEYVFRPTPLDFVVKPGKFLNEFTRADKDFQDQLLSLLDRRMVEHRGERFTSPKFVLFADNNPHKLLMAEIDWALWDRIDVELFLSGANLGTKDMVLSRRFGREDQRFGREKIKQMDDELLDRIAKAVPILNMPDASSKFSDTGEILSIPGHPQAIIPIRFRELQAIWRSVNKVSIPRSVLRYVYLLTTTMNQSWYLRKVVVNTSKDADRIEFGDTKMVGDNFKPYGTDIELDPKIKTEALYPRDTVMDFSMLSFAQEFIKFSAIVADKKKNAANQFPLGITRPVGIRFVISLLKFAKSLAWLRRGNTEVTIKEIDDLFPVTGSHRLNLMPFGEERIAGVDKCISELYPNIQDYLKYGILKNYWFGRKDEYLNYYADLEAVVDAGFLDVDKCAPHEMSVSGGKCGLKGVHNHSGLTDPQDIMVLVIQNGVEFAKRNSPEYKQRYARRLAQITSIGSKNYYMDFLDDAISFINKYDMNIDPKSGESQYPWNFFKKDSDELISRINGLSDIFQANKHMVYMTSPDIIDKVVIPVLKDYRGPDDPDSKKPDLSRSRIDPKDIPKLDDIIKELEKLMQIYREISAVMFMDAMDIPTISDEIERLLSSLKKGGSKSLSKKDIEKMDKNDIISALNDRIKDYFSIDKEIRLKPTGYKDSKKDDIRGKLQIVFNPQDNKMYINLIASTMNEHLMWRRIRFGEPLSEVNTITDADKLD